MLELGRSDAAVFRGEDAGPLWSALAEFQAVELGPVTIVANLRPSSVVGFVAGLDPSSWSVQSHAGNGIVRGHALGSPGLDELAPEIDRLRASAVRDCGNLTMSRCPTEWKDRLRVWGEPRDDWALAERVKRALDPKGVMNPGRFVGTI
jgi:glycolate oxidase FAD binding subunit